MLLKPKQVKPLSRLRRRNLKTPVKQQGVVIVVALFIVALVATMSYLMLTRLMRDTLRTTLIVRNAQAELYAQGSLAWAIDTLQSNLAKQKQDHIIDPVPIVSTENEVDGYHIQSTIYDAQSRFNINNISTPEGQQIFQQLLKNVEPTIIDNDAQKLINAINDWISPTNKGTEYSDYYRGLPLPYRAAHQPMVTISELNLVKGMNAKLFSALKPFIIALPEQSTPINIQSALPEVLAALPTMTGETAKVILQARKDKPFVTLDSFKNLDVIKNHEALNNSTLTVLSSYFLVETHVRIEDQKIVLFTLLQRIGKDTGAKITPLWQSKLGDN